MLKKFRHFFKEEPEVNLNFTPYVTTLAGRTMQVMQASEVNIPDLLELEKYEKSKNRIQEMEGETN